MDRWIDTFLKRYGSFGVGVLMLVENVFPPIPSEVVMPWAGYAVSQGEFSFLMAVVAGSMGSFAGAMFWYWIAIWIGQERLAHWVDRHGQWLTISPRDLERTESWFARWGAAAVLFCRLIPGLRTLISVPAGFAEMPLGRFAFYTAIGTVLWTALLAALGWWLGDNYAELAGPLSWVSTGVVLLLAGIWIYRLVTRHGRSQRTESGNA